MTAMLRGVLIAASVFTLLLVIRKIRQSRMQIEDSIFWVFFSCLLIAFSVFPQVVYDLSSLVGTMAPSNFIFLFVIFIMLVKIFMISIRISRLESELKEVIQQQALAKYLLDREHAEERDENKTVE